MRKIGLLLVCVGSWGVAGCASPVAPWERGVLAKPHMAVELDAASAWRGHVQSSREAGLTQPVLDGGGCGCY